MSRAFAPLAGPTHRRRDIAVALVLAAGCASPVGATDPTGFQVRFPTTPTRWTEARMEVETFFTAEPLGCGELEAMVAASNPNPPIALATLQHASVQGWPASLSLSFSAAAWGENRHPEGRVFGAVVLKGVAHATFCSAPVPADVLDVEVELHLLRTRPGPPMQSPRARHTATPLAEGRVLVLGGSGSASSEPPEVYDGATDTFSSPGPLRVPRSGHSATLLLDGRVLVAGGISVGTGRVAMPRVELIDPTAGTSTLAEDMATTRQAHGAVRLPDGRVLVTGGSSGDQFWATSEFFQPDGGTWSAGPQMAEARASHTATLLETGQVLVAGGVNADGGLASTELFDPATETFVPGPAMQQARYAHLAVTLGDGRVLLAGGYSFESVELFDPRTRTFTAAARLPGNEFGPCGARLADGAVVLVGGSQLVRRYDPATDGWTEPGVLSQPRQGCAAWPGADGGLVVAGGYGWGTLGSTEVVDP